ncbi:WD40 repeat domain-containing protein [Naegleria gruberi]|uniref:WD40 repeat domain-containing protein n=1 Tax=Naegleria gruberi TaxID=5762 RepID=D2V7D8_NAEGR|nr:WD40 repeat domain-containing protein [Naegleria gruberi]EFC47236.1 WD40 repeat domain-containing protein [Naegleria gruberi]|eukprot:XP_002679980.1 WD40 repeat domain-containing protein [Naegleria gruberi strain NEG-M]
MVKPYYRIVPERTTGTIASPYASIHYDQTKASDIVYSPMLYQIGVWNKRENELVSIITPQDESYYGGSINEGTMKYSNITFITHCNNFIAAGYQNGKILIYNLKTSEQVLYTTGHSSSVSYLQFNSDCSLLVSGGDDTDIVCWDITACQAKFRLRGHKGRITGLIFLEKTNALISSSKDMLIKVWELTTYHCVQTLIGSRNEIWSICVDSDEHRLFAGSTDSEIRVWDIQVFLNKETQYFYENDPVFMGTLKRRDESRVLQMKFDHTGTLLAIVGSDSKIVEIFKMRNEKEIEKKRKNAESLTPNMEYKWWLQIKSNYEIRSLDFNPFESVLTRSEISTDSEDKLSTRILNAKMNDFRVIISTLRNTIEEYKIEPNKIVKSNQDQYQGITCTNTIERQGHGTPVRSISISDDNVTCMSLSSKECHIWNLENGKCIKTLNDVDHGLSAIWIPYTNNRYCLVGTKKGNIQIYDVNISECIETIQAHSSTIYSIQFVPPSSFNDNNGGIITASSDKCVKFWEFEMKGKNLSLAIKNVLEMNEEIIAITVSKNAKYLAVSLLDNTVKIFYMDTMKFFLSLYGHKLPIKCLDISSDEQLIVTGSDDKNIKIWGLDFGDCHRSLLAHEQGITSVKFINDTHYFFSASKDGNIKYWDGDKFELIQVVTSQYISKSPLWCLDISSDGHRMVTSGHERALFIYTQSDDMLFLEEEKEKRFEEEQLEKDLPHSQQFKDLSLAGAEVTHAGQRSMETIRDGEKLMENLDVAINEEINIIESIANNVTIPKNPLLLGLSIEEYVWKCLTRIARSDLDMVLSIIHFSHAYFILKQVNKLMKQKSVDIELSTRIVLLLIHIHYKQLVQSNSDQETFDLMQSLHELVRNGLVQQSKRIGFNVAALQFVKNRMKNEQELFEFNKESKVNDIVKSYRERQREKKRLAKYEAEQSSTGKKKKEHKRMAKFKGMLDSMIEKIENDPTKQVVFESNVKDKKISSLKRKFKEMEDKKTKKLKSMIQDDDDTEDFLNELSSWD